VSAHEPLGWPSAERTEQFSTGLGWPAERANPQKSQSYPQPEDRVSRETSPQESRLPEQEQAVEPPHIRTAAELEADLRSYDDQTTPMARAIEAELQARRQLSYRDPLPRPDRTRVMVVANQKGGVGKTTTTVNLAAALAMHDLRVLVIDLAGAEIELVRVVARESRLRKALAAYGRIGDAGEDRLDYVLIDCPPSLGLLTLNALVAGVEMLIPIQAEYYALEGLGQLVETVEMVKAHLNQDLTISTILITMYDSRTNLAAGVAEEVRKHFQEQVLPTSIPRSVRVSEAPSYGQTVMTYDPGSPGALSYLQAARELAVRGAGHE
jgi:chromosome partitioning protein